MVTKYFGRRMFLQETNGSIPAPQEMETFLSPEEKKNEIVVSKYNLAKDAESAEFDPFNERKLENPTSNNDTLTHLLKASLGTGILAMPKAFKCAGLVNGILFTVLVAVVCTHCSYILIKCAHVLYKKTRRTNMTFPEVAASFKGVGEDDIDIRFYITCLLVPLILMAYVRNLKYLAPVSMIANVFMAVGLGITFYYLVGTGELKTSEMNNMLFKMPSEWPEFFSLSIFAMEAIGVVMPLENAMKTPRSMLGVCGVLNKGMSGVTLVYILLGFLGYLRYGEDVKDSITLNLEQGDTAAQIVKVSIAIAVYCTFGLQFFVCIEIVWNTIKDKFTKRPNLADYFVRTVLVTICVLLAVAVPTIAPFMGVIGAFCFSILGLIAPAFIEVITYWDIGFGRFNFIIWKNVLVLIFGLFALIFGTKEAVISIINEYTK
ncbi:Proton-coupled amino acid transporter 4 [Operophtera brumata]|uniref:Proton-coupled amino acid transporter 4 n=1 Tax=Operophtera brumata TaxID=104452 RepID=A0A0L7LDU2_OPEBR|nr:Proton-coupled amino acid transporter 4 [Operophtera brumata]